MRLNPEYLFVSANFFQRNTVSLWVRRYAEEGTVRDHRHENSGRRPSLSSEQRNLLRIAYEQNAFFPVKHFAEHFGVCPQVIRNNLHSMGLQYRHHVKKPFLSETHKIARLNFATQYLDFDWSRTVFTDEKCFKSNDHGRLSLWRYDRTRYTEDHVIPLRNSGRLTANMWGWMSADGVGELCFIPTRANALTYVDILEEVMLPTVRNVYPVEDYPEIDFIQDNCPIHTAHVTNEWFSQHLDIKKVSWPAMSPDLNAIENLWGLMVQRWDHRNERSKEAISSHCMQIWEQMRGTDVTQRLVGSMRERLQAVIDARGGYTRY